MAISKKEPDIKEIRPVLIAYPSIYSLLMLNYWVAKRKIKFAGIILSQSHITMKGIKFSFLESFYILCKKSGLSYALYMFFIIKGSILVITVWNFITRLKGEPLRLKTFNRIAKEAHIPLLKAKNINSLQAVNLMKAVGANVIVSGYNNQILRYRICKEFALRGINIHNAYLPDFGGLDAAFETIYEEVAKSGATIHYIDKGVDTGRIISQERIAVKPDDTVFSLNIHQWLKGAELLPAVFKIIAEGEVETKKQDSSQVKYPYRSFPDKKRVKEIIKRGRRIILLRDILRPNPYVCQIFK